MTKHEITPADMTIVHVPERHRYELLLAENLAGFCEYTEQAGVRDFHHTVTTPGYRGQGIASLVTKFALNDCKENSIQILTSCSYVHKFVQENPEYQSLLPQ